VRLAALPAPAPDAPLMRASGICMTARSPPTPPSWLPLPGLTPSHGPIGEPRSSTGDLAPSDALTPQAACTQLGLVHGCMGQGCMAPHACVLRRGVKDFEMTLEMR
jgi:hypothetical protein